MVLLQLVVLNLTSYTLIGFHGRRQNTKDGKTTIELALIVPVTLGRMDFNDAQIMDVDLALVGAAVGSPATIANNVRHVFVATSATLLPKKTLTLKENCRICW